MTSKTAIIIPIFLFILAFAGCEKGLIQPLEENTPMGNFESMWRTVDEKYSFFDLKQIDWNEVYSQYKPLIRDDMTDQELFDVLAGMLYVLRDGHVNLFSEFDLSRNWEWYLNSPQNFNFTNLERTYLGSDYLITGPFRAQVIDSVGYIYYGSFIARIRPEHIDFLVNEFRDLKGIILDVRDNGGGSLGNVATLVSRFADSQRTNYVFQYKEGPGHDEFGIGLGTSFAPVDQPFTKPVVVLINRSSYSATTFFAQSMRVYPHVTLVGDTTGGGGGVPWDYELPNGWKYRFSTSRTFSPAPEFMNIEMGVPPDSVVWLDPVLEAQGRDNILETALELID